MTGPVRRRPLRYRGFERKTPRVSLAVAIALSAFAIYTAFAVVRGITAAAPKHGPNRFFVPALVVLTLLALWAAYGARRSWRSWRRNCGVPPM
jgi:hypothetical protein